RPIGYRDQNIIAPLGKQGKLRTRYSGSFCPRVSTPQGNRKMPTRNASEVKATGVPMEAMRPTAQPTRRVTPAPRKRPEEVAKPKALPRHSVRYCSGSHSEYMAKFAPPKPSTARLARNHARAWLGR